MAEKTRAEHIAWCKERAFKEMDYYKDPKQGIISMMSDLRKHPDTNSPTLQMMCTLELMKSPTISSAGEFINGFN